MVIPWGNATLTIDNEEFLKGYEDGRKLYQAKVELSMLDLSASELLDWYAIHGWNGYHRLDKESNENVAKVFGQVVGYMSGPLLSE